MIRKQGFKFVLYTKDGKKKLGEYSTRQEAEKREQQIKFYKAKTKK